MVYRKYLNAKSDLVQQIIDNEIYFPSVGHATDYLSKLFEDIYFSSESGEGKNKFYITWITDFELTEELKNKGYKGNYCKIYINEKKNYYFIQLELVNQNLNSHPRFERAKYPNLIDSAITKILNGELITDNEYQCKKYLEYLIKKYTNFPNYSDNENELVLWVWQYELNEEDIKKGYRGNFLKLFIEKTGNKYKIKHRKLVIDLKKHPSRKNIVRDLPNRNEKLIRLIDNKTVFKNLDEAIDVLDRLNSKYPNASIPITPDKILLNIYSKLHGKERYKSHILEIKQENNLYYIDKKINFKLYDLSKKTDEFYYSTFLHT